MNAKEYLRQAWNIDQRIKDKMEQLKRLKEMSTNVTSVISDMPRRATPNPQKMEDAVLRLAEMESEIDADISSLVNLKIEIMQTIWQVEDANCRTLLEMRYISFKSWEEIAAAMGITVRWLHRLHAKALRLVGEFTKIH
ncbi:MAG: DUF1492 domain-containing protein [Schwartzia sp.]|nr:DUF1492 domain-containing protein [Schwartzia sp. (in: firmicutes)]